LYPASLTALTSILDPSSFENIGDYIFLGSLGDPNDANYDKGSAETAPPHEMTVQLADGTNHQYYVYRKVLEASVDGFEMRFF